MKRLILAIIAAALSLAVTAAQARPEAYTVETVPNVHVADARQYVTDPSAILSASARDSINAVCARLERERGIEAAVVMLPSIGDADGFDFAQSLFRRWGIGKKGRDNGVLVLFVMDRRVIRFHTGYGLEGTLTDALCKRIQQRFMVPAFKEADWDRGMTEGVAEMARVLLSGEAEQAPGDDDDGALAAVVLIIMVAGVITVITLVGYESSRCPQCRKRKLTRVSRQKLRLSTGRRVIRTTYRCKNCGKTVVRVTPDDEPGDDPGAAAATGFIIGSMLGGGRSGGGFGGTFGGGSSGGGGASSGW